MTCGFKHHNPSSCTWKTTVVILKAVFLFVLGFFGGFLLGFLLVFRGVFCCFFGGFFVGFFGVFFVGFSSSFLRKILVIEINVTRIVH